MWRRRERAALALGTFNYVALVHQLAAAELGGRGERSYSTNSWERFMQHVDTGCAEIYKEDSAIVYDMRRADTVEQQYWQWEATAFNLLLAKILTSSDGGAAEPGDAPAGGAGRSALYTSLNGATPMTEEITQRLRAACRGGARAEAAGNGSRSLGEEAQRRLESDMFEDALIGFVLVSTDEQYDSPTRGDTDDRAPFEGDYGR